MGVCLRKGEPLRARGHPSIGRRTLEGRSGRAFRGSGLLRANPWCRACVGLVVALLRRRPLAGVGQPSLWSAWVLFGLVRLARACHFRGRTQVGRVSGWWEGIHTCRLRFAQPGGHLGSADPTLKEDVIAWTLSDFVLV